MTPVSAFSARPSPTPALPAQRAPADDEGRLLRAVPDVAHATEDAAPGGHDPSPSTDLDRAVDLLDEGVAVLALEGPTALIHSGNASLARLLGLPPQALVGLDLLTHATPAGAPVLAAAVARAAASEGVVEATTVLTRGDASWLATLRLQRQPMVGGSPPVRVAVVVTDLTQRVAEQEALAHARHVDDVTGGPTRGWVDAELHRLVDAGIPFGLLVIGIAGLAELNGIRGRACGDELLAVARDRVLQVTGPGALVGRYVGNEFVVAVQGDPSTLRAHTHALAEALEAALDRSAEVQGEDYRLVATVGTAVHPLDARDLPDLLDVATVQLWDVRRHRGSRLAAAAWRLRWLLHPPR